MRRICRVVTACILVTAILVPLCGCAYKSGAERSLSAIIAAWSKLDVDTLYDQLDFPDGEAPDKQAFTERLTNIWNGLSVKSAQITPHEGEKSGNTYTVPVTITYESVPIQDFTFDANVTLVHHIKGWRMAWDYNLLLPGMQADDEVSLSTIAAPRGEIFTSDREVVARNAYAPTVYAQMDKVDDQAACATQLAPIVNMEVSQITEIFQSDATKRDGVAIIKVYSPTDDIAAVSDALVAITGVGIDKSYLTPIRLYPTADKVGMLAHLVGYTGVMSKEDLETYQDQGYTNGDIIGKQGLEQTYESTLRGKRGYRLVLTRKSQQEGEDPTAITLANVPAQAGTDVTLSIDSKLQLRAEALLKERLEAGQAGSVVVLNPKTGFVEAMASYPVYDANFFTLPMDSTAKEALWAQWNDENGMKPLYARCTQGRYAPGSTFKPFTAAAALESGTLNVNSTFTEPIVANKWRPSMQEWVYPAITRYRGYAGACNMTNAMINSDNIYYAYAAMQMGMETFTNYVGKIGFTESIPFDVPVAQGQLSTKGGLTLENIKFLADCGYGQGEMLISPLHMSALFSAFANDGNVMQPRVVAHTDRMVGTRYVRQETMEPVLWRSNIVDAASISAIEPMLKKVVTEGTAQVVNIKDLGVAAKTGTAEVGKERQISWFIGYNTQGEDDRLVCVTLEVQANKGAQCNQIAREMFLQQKSSREAVNITDNDPNTPPQGYTE
nr:penicillin-binding transpeptidase domain-containing protein [Maliibacterium massiliense]